MTDDYGNVYQNINGQWVLVRGRAPATPKESGSLADLAKQKAISEGEKYLGNKAKDMLSQATGIGGGAAAANAIGGGATAAASEGIGAGLVQTEAANAAWNAPGLAATEAAAPSMFSLGGIGSAGNVLLPAAGAIGLYDLATHRDRIGTGMGYLEGAASGAAMGSYFGPVGIGVGAGVGLLANAFGIGGESRTKGEEKLRDSLAEQGVMVPNSDIKEWENNAIFKESRKESDLTGKDIIHAADFYAQIPGYQNLDAAKQETIANEALKQGLIDEKLGKVNLSLNDAYKDFLNTQMTGPAPTQQRTDNRQVVAENAKQRKKQALSAIMPDISAPVTKSPRYDQNPGGLINNPYL